MYARAIVGSAIHPAILNNDSKRVPGGDIITSPTPLRNSTTYKAVARFREFFLRFHKDKTR
jgi:hypothetical protein